MSNYDVTANGTGISDGSASAVVIRVSSGSGASISAGVAHAIVTKQLRITQVGLGLDTAGAVDVRVTQAGLGLDVDKTVPVNVTQAGLGLDVEGIVPVNVTQAGLGLDVDRIVPVNITQVALLVDARLKRRRTMTTCWEFHVTTRGGTYLAFLDGAYNKQILMGLNEPGSGSFSIMTDDAKATPTNLLVGNRVLVRYANVDIFTFILEETNETLIDSGEGAARVITCSGRGLLSGLEGGLVYPEDLGEPTTVERLYTAQRKAAIWLALYDEYVMRGGGILTPSFTPTLDTNLNGWSDSVTLTFKAGQTLLDVLNQLIGLGLEITVDPGGTMNGYPTSGAGQNLSGSVVFRQGQTITSCTRRIYGQDLANAVLAEGQGTLVESTNPTSITTYGRQEAYLPIQNTDDAGLIGDAADVMLDTYKEPPSSIGLGVYADVWFPGLDYEVGDEVFVSIPGDIAAAYRIRAIAIKELDNPCSLQVVLELNSRRTEYLLRLDQAMRQSLLNVRPGVGAASGMASTTTSSGGGGGAEELALNDLSDVTISAPADNEVLAFDNASGEWINQTATEAGLMPDVLTTKGDLLTRSSTAYGRLPVGENGEVLTADNAEPLGVKWAAGAATGCDSSASGTFEAMDAFVIVENGCVIEIIYKSSTLFGSHQTAMVAGLLMGAAMSDTIYGGA